jgi:sodium transport system permease protein
LADLRAGKIDAYVTFEKPETVHVNVAQSNLIDKTAAKVMGAISTAHWAEERAAEKKAGLTRAELRVFDVEQIEVAPSESKQGELVPVQNLGGVPMMLLALVGFIWVHIVIGMGPPATIMFAEQREKKTIETTLLEPVSRTSLVGAKFLAVWIIGMITGLMYTIGIALTIGTIAMALASHMGTKFGHSHFPHLFFANGVAPQSWVLLVAAVIVNTALSAILFIVFAARANTFKQAQALVTIPMMVLIMLPLISFLPGMELNSLTALIPTMNLFLVLKRGEPNVALTAIALAWDALLIVASVYFTRYLISIEQGAA